jgi:hypothetical protein
MMAVCKYCGKVVSLSDKDGVYEYRNIPLTEQKILWVYHISCKRNQEKKDE